MYLRANSALANSHYQQLTWGASPIRGIRCSSFCDVNCGAVAALGGGFRLWTAQDIAEATGGKVLTWARPGSICSDTRRLDGTGQWFLAIQGINFDGHDFISPNLTDRGCVGVIGNRVCEGWTGGFVMVEGNTLAAMRRMATHARDRFNGVVVGVTGSAGKTTTKAMTALTLEGLGSGDVYESPGNWNNELGVGLSLIAMPAESKAAVLELATSGIGEILDLARMCRPDVRVILNVGYSHMEKLRSLATVAAAKGEILSEAKLGDVCVLNGDDPMVRDLTAPEGVKKVFFGKGENCDVRLVEAENIDAGRAIRFILQNQLSYHDRRRSASHDRVEVKMQTPGLHLAMDACAATAVAISLGVSFSCAADALSKFKPISMRLQMTVTTNGIQIINDTYNANLISMTSAIETLKAMECDGKKIAVLGDMLELGLTAPLAHSKILKLCEEASIDLVVLVGENFVAATKRHDLFLSNRMVCALDVESIAAQVTKMVDVGDAVLVKGSRGMQMEKVVEAIKMADGLPC